MDDAVLKIFGRGQVTLPVKMRKLHPARHFMARATQRGILLEPIYPAPLAEDDEGVELIETDKEIRLHFKNGGMPAEKALALLTKAHNKLKKAHATSRKISR